MLCWSLYRALFFLENTGFLHRTERQARACRQDPTEWLLMLRFFARYRREAEVAELRGGAQDRTEDLEVRLETENNAGMKEPL